MFAVEVTTVALVIIYAWGALYASPHDMTFLWIARALSCLTAFINIASRKYIFSVLRACVEVRILLLNQ